MISNRFTLLPVLFFTCTTAAYAAKGAVHFTDMSQQNIELAAPAQRIVVIPIPAASMLVSVDESSKRLARMHPFAVLPPATACSV